MNNKEEKNKSFFSKVLNIFKSGHRKITNNPAISKTFVWSISLLILFIAIGGGFIHKHKVELARAYNLSDIDQEISFSKTGTEVKLAKQKRYKNMTVIPIKFDNGDKQSLNAKDYFVGIESKDGDALSSNISASLASFSSDGNMALVLKGKLPKQPIQIILRNDNNFTEENDGSGTYMNWGKEQKTKLNVVAFTINPKGNNVKLDKRINSNMPMKDLYAMSFGDQKLNTLSKEKSKTEKKIKDLSRKKSEYHRQITQLNKALDKKENDFNLETIDNGDDTDTGYESKLKDSDYDNLEHSDLSSSDMKSERNTKVNNYDSIKDDIKDEERNLKAIGNKVKEEKEYTNKMEELTSISNRFKVINK